MSSDARRRSSISKHRGAEMSSRLIAPKPGAIAVTAATISSTSVVARQIGQPSTPANSFNSIALPSITGIAASGPMSPSPSTAVPSETTATVLRLIVRLHAFSGSSAIASETRATPGVYAIERSSRVYERRLQRHLDLAAEMHQEGAVGDVLHLDARELARLRPPTAAMWSASRASTVTSRTFMPGSDAHEIDRLERGSRVRDHARELRRTRRAGRPDAPEASR